MSLEKQAGPRPASARQNPKNGSAAKAAKRRILLADDHLMTREGLPLLSPLRHVVEGILNEPGRSVPVPTFVLSDILASMQGQSNMDETDPDADLKNTKQPLRIVIAYDDLAAGQRAMRVMADLGKGLGDEIEFEPLPWPFALLADIEWGKVGERDAVNADILILATSSQTPLPPPVGRWAEAAIHRKRGTAAAVVVLFGPNEDPDGAGSSRLEAIQTATRRAGLDFFAPSRRHEPGETIVRVHQRA